MPPSATAHSGKPFPLLQLRRITTSNSYIPEIDGLRFVAILAVVLFHVPIQIALRSAGQVASNPFWKKIPGHWTWDILSVASWTWIFVSDAASLHLLLPIITLRAYLAAFKGPIFHAFFRHTWISIAGGMCYSIYLTHNLAISAVDLLLRRLSWLAHRPPWQHAVLAYVLVVPAVAFLSLLLYILVERPCMDKSWPEKLLHRLRPASHAG